MSSCITKIYLKSHFSPPPVSLSLHCCVIWFSVLLKNPPPISLSKMYPNSPAELFHPQNCSSLYAPHCFLSVSYLYSSYKQSSLSETFSAQVYTLPSIWIVFYFEHIEVHFHFCWQIWITPTFYWLHVPNIIAQL